jgi:hypothetical protein
MTTQRVGLFSAVFVVVLVTVAGRQYARDDDGDSARRQMLERSLRQIKEIPDQIAGWHLEATEPFSARTVQMLKVDGYTARSYVHAETGEHATLILLVGAAGPLVAHSPEVCLGSRDYEMISPPQAEQIMPEGGQAAELRRATFQAHTVQREMFDVYYAWSRDGRDWQSPEHPRVTLGGNALLFKLQVSARASEGTDDPEMSVSKRFLRDLLPVLEQTLYTPAASAKL